MRAIDRLGLDIEMRDVIYDNARRDELMFNAGRATAVRHRRPWQLLSIVLACVLAGSLALRPEPKIHTIENIEYVYTSMPTSPSTAVINLTSNTHRPNPNSYINIRNKILTNGLDSLPENQPKTSNKSETKTQKQLLQEMLSS